MQKQGVDLAHERYEEGKFYLGEVGFASMNYDPIGLWCQYVANRYLNNSPACTAYWISRKPAEAIQ